MKKIKVIICTGTACYVMGGSELLLLEEKLPENLKGKVDIECVTCLDRCKSFENGKPPFVLLEKELVPEATIGTIIEKITEKLNA
ncbi:MAG TPA: hypothetical protein VFC68_07690 [Treponemataceae bacterium]|nr:hypothetical protein [Treponemataceae bacterium]